MPQKQKIKFSLALVLLISLFTLTGCITIITKKTDGGIYKSFNKADTWEPKSFVSQFKKKIVTISDVNVKTIALSPQDSNFIYLGTIENGLYASFDGGEKWSSVLTNKGRIESIAFDPLAPAIAYISQGSKIFKTSNKGENWEEVYLEAGQQVINYLAVDPKDTNKIYAGLKDGRLLKSLDYGKTWQVVNDFENEIRQVLINKNNPSIIYVGTTDEGFYRSSDQGLTWQDLTKEEGKFSGIRNFIIGVFDSTKPDALIIATRYGLLKTDDGGKTWQEIKLLTLPEKANIVSLTINPSNANEIYYGTDGKYGALFKTDDGGKTWKTIPLPSPRAPFYLAIDHYNPDIIYLGVYKIK